MTDKESPVIGQRFDDDIADETRAIGTGSDPHFDPTAAAEMGSGGKVDKKPNGTEFSSPSGKDDQQKKANKGRKEEKIEKITFREPLPTDKRNIEGTAGQKKLLGDKEDINNRLHLSNTDQKAEKNEENNMPISFANQSDQKGHYEILDQNLKNGIKEQISFAEFNNGSPNTGIKAGVTFDSQEPKNSKKSQNLKEKKGQVRPNSTYKISEEKSKESSLQPRLVDTPISTAFGLKSNKSKSNERPNSHTKLRLIEKSPPRKVMKFYEKGDPSQIVDLDSTAVFKNGVLGTVHNKGSNEKFKKKGHLRQMEDLLTKMNQYEQSTPVNGSSFAAHDQSQDQPRKDLFFKRYSKPINPAAKIDHEAIKYHAASVMVSHLEAEKQREERRKRFVEEWKKNQVNVTQRRSADNYSSYKRIYRDQLEKSMETQNKLDKLKEKRVNRYMYGEMLRQVGGEIVKTSLDPKRRLRSASPNQENIKRYNAQLEEMKKKKEIGEKYLKFSTDIGKELMSSPKVNLKSKVSNSLANTNQKGGQKSLERRKRTKEEIKSAYTVHNIFASEKKLPDDKGHNYQKLATLRKADKFKSPETQSLAVKALKDIDRELKIKEREIKKGVENGEDIDLEYLRSIKTKIEVISQRLNTKLERFQAENPAKSSQKNINNINIKNRAEEMKRQRAQSAMRPVMKASAGRKTPPASGSRPNDINRSESRGKIQARVQSGKVNKQVKGQAAPERKPVIGTEAVKKEQPTGKNQDKGNLKKDNEPKETQAKNQGDEKYPKGATKPFNRQAIQTNKANDIKAEAGLGRARSKEFKVPVLDPGTYDSTDEKGIEIESPSPSVVKTGKQGMTKEEKEHPLVKRLSQDLDADPSESMSASHQKRHQQELGEYFKKKVIDNQEKSQNSGRQNQMEDEF